MWGIDAQESATGTPGAALALIPAGDPPAHQTGRSSVLSQARGAFPLFSTSRRLRCELAPALSSVLPGVASCGLGQREARRQDSQEPSGLCQPCLGEEALLPAGLPLLLLMGRCRGSRELKSSVPGMD